MQRFGINMLGVLIHVIEVLHLAPKNIYILVDLLDVNIKLMILDVRMDYHEMYHCLQITGETITKQYQVDCCYSHQIHNC